MTQPLSDLHQPQALLTSHALNLMSGRPAVGIDISLFQIQSGIATLINRMTTNEDGRCEAPLLTKNNASVGTYQLEFSAANAADKISDYFEVVPVEFSISDPDGHYHIPLVLAPYGYSTYRGAPPHRSPCDFGRWAVKTPDPITADTPAAPPPGQGGAGLTVHVIDIARGCGGGPMLVELSKDPGAGRQQIRIASSHTTAEGRTPEWLVSAGELEPGVYELAFYLGQYFSEAGIALGKPHFFERALVRFHVSNPDSHYHIPLLVAPWGYSAYRGS